MRKHAQDEETDEDIRELHEQYEALKKQFAVCVGVAPSLAPGGRGMGEVEEKDVSSEGQGILGAEGGEKKGKAIS